LDPPVSGGCAAAPPGVPSLSASVNGGFARVTWSAAPGATRYLIQAGTTVGGSDLFAGTDVGSSTTAGAAVPPGFRAWVRVFAANSCGVSAPADVFVQ
jgi:hypothetical protein